MWSSLPEQVRQAIEQAGYKHKAPYPPPGLPQRRSPKVASDDQAEAAKGLWESATDSQKQLLRQAGVPEPVSSEPPNLAALCKQHLETLPPSIQQAIAELDPPAPTQTQQIETATRRFKQSTTELRQMIQQTAGLQIRIDRAKATYQELLEKMKVCQSELQSKQSEVTTMQKELETTIRADAATTGDSPELAGPFEGLLETLTKCGISLTAEQLASYEEAKKQHEACKRPQAMNVDEKSAEAPAGNPDERRASGNRSRSRGRTSQG